MIKKVDTTRAITFKSPIMIPAKAITNVSKSAFRGSFPAPTPLANTFGVILSIAVAWSILGAPNNPPKADERVAPHIPAITKGEYSDMFRSTEESLSRASRSTV